MRDIYKFAASVKLAIPLMLIFAFAMIAGTILESKVSTEFAQETIYYHWWFTVLTALIAINILLATIIRYPFKKSQTGFVITHSGLLLIFGGSILNQITGIDGTLVLREGMKSNIVELRADEDQFILPFLVELKEFRMSHETETQALMDYESDVIVNGAVHKISMNEPFQLDGFYVYQSSYQLDEANGNISIFSVGYDPGRAMKYFGSLFLVLGMSVMYWFKAGIFATRKVVNHRISEEKIGAVV